MTARGSQGAAERRTLPPFEPRRLARRTDDSTSRGAAEAAEGLRTAHAELVVEVLEAEPEGLTVDEIAGRIRTGGVEIDRVAVGKRMAELERAGSILRTNDTRPNRNNRQARVWRFAP